MANSFYPKSLTDIKIFTLFLLDYVKGPISRTDLTEIIMKNIVDVTFSYGEALNELVESGHVYYDSFDGEEYYMIGDSGRVVSAELYDTLPITVREDVIASVSRYVRLSNSHITLTSEIIDGEKGEHYTLKVAASDDKGEFINVSLKVPSRSEAERMKDNFENNPSGIYRGFLFALTGRLELL